MNQMESGPRSRKFNIVFLALGVIALGALIVFSRGGSSTNVAKSSLRGANILLVTLDTTRADRSGNGDSVGHSLGAQGRSDVGQR